MPDNDDPLGLNKYLSPAPIAPSPRGRPGITRHQPASDWSINKLPEVESAYQQSTGRALPIRVRGQGAIHNKWELQHQDSADIGLNPTSPEGQTLMAQLKERNVPFLAFDRAIPGVATGPHVHIGRPSHRGRTVQDDDPLGLNKYLQQPLSEIATGGGPVLEQVANTPIGTPQRIKPRKFIPAGPFQPATPQEQTQIKRAIPFKPAGPFGQASQGEQEVIRRAVAPTIRGQRMSTVPRVATEGVLEGAAGWTQSLESLSEMLPDVLAHVLPAARVAQTSGWNPVAKKLQEATDALRSAAEQTDVDPATGKPFRDAMSYWQSVPLDVLQAGVKAGFDIPRYVLLTRVAGPVMGFGIEGGLSAPPEERGKGVLAGTAMGGAFKRLEAAKPLVKTLPRRIGSFGALGATQTAGEQALIEGEVDPRSVMSSAITMGALGALGGRRAKTKTQPNVAAQPEAIEPVATRSGAPEAVAQRMAGSDAIVPETIRPPRMEVVEPQAWHHRDLGLVKETPNQGVGKKRVRVVDETGKEHVIKRAALTGAGNQIAIPVKVPPTVDTLQGQPNLLAEAATKSAEVTPVEGAQPAMETTPSLPHQPRMPEQWNVVKPNVKGPDGTTSRSHRVFDAQGELLASGKSHPEVVAKAIIVSESSTQGGKQDAAVNKAAVFEEQSKPKSPEGASVIVGDTPVPSIKPSDYINLKRLNISEEEKVNLGKTVSQMVSEGRVSKTKVTFEDIKREAAALDPNLVRNLKPVPPGETLRPEVRFAARERLNTLNSEAVRLQKELDASRITGEVKDLDALQAKLNTIENDSKGLLDVLIPTRSQDGRNLAYHNMMAQKSMDAEYWISRARRVAERSGEDVTGKSYQKKEQVIRQTLASGSEAEARVATLEKQIAELRTKLEKADSGAEPVTEPKRAFRQKVESLQARLDAQAEAAALRIKHLMDPAKLHDVTDFVQAIPDIAIWGAAKLAKKGVSAAAFAEEMVGTFGERIRPHLKEIYRQSYSLYQKESKVLAEEAKVRTVTKGEPDKFTQPQIDKLLVETEAAKKEHQQARIKLARTFANLEKTSKLEAASLFIKAGLLTGFRTHEANIAGTAGHLAFEEISRVPASIVDMVRARARQAVTGEYRRTISGLNPAAVARSSREAASKGVKEAVQILKHGAADRDLAKLEIKREMNSGWPLIDNYVNGVFRLLGAEDKVFRTYAERRSREDQARVIALNEAHKGTIKRGEIGERTKELAASPTAEMVATSIFDAEVATFNNQGSLAKATHASKRVLGSPGRFVFDRFVPFTQTPSNIVTRMLEATPLGGAYGPARAAYQIASKAFTKQEERAFAQTMGRSVNGSGLIVLGYVLAAKGLMTGLRDDEPGKAGRDEAAGRPPMAVKAYGQWWQIGRMQPVSTLMIIGATLHREGHQELKDESIRPGKIAAIGTKAVLEQPMLKGVSALTDALSHPGQKVNSLVGGIAGSVVPTLVSDVGATIDNTRREAKSVKDRIQVRLPGLRQSLPVDRDVFGDPLQSRRTAIIDPTLHTTAKEESSPMYKELVRLDASIPRSQRRQDEPAEAYQARLIAEGRAMKAAATQLTSMPRYKLLNDEEKREALKDAFAQAKDYVKKSGAAKAKKKVQGRSAGFKFNPRSLSAQ